MIYLKQLFILLFIFINLLLNASDLEKSDTNNNDFILKSEFQKKAKLSSEEKSYLKENIIKIGMVKDYYPFSYKENGNLNGFSYEYFSLLASKVNMKFDIEINNWSSTLENFKNKKIDIIDAISYTKKRVKFTNFSDTYFQIPNVIFARKDSIQNYKGLKSLKGKKVGITKGIYYFKDIENLGLFKLVVFESSRKKIEALAYGKIDAAFNNLTSGQKYILQGGYSNIQVIDQISDSIVKKEDLRLGIEKENILLFSIIKKATTLITQTEKLNLINKYFGLDFQKKYNKEQLSLSSTLKLTKKEKEFLKKHPKIILGTGDSWAPYSIKNKDGSIIGYDQDILDKINKITGANFVLKLGEWVKMQELAKKGRLDGLATLTKTNERDKFLNFTKPYGVLTKNVMVKTGNPLNIQSFKDLDGKTIVIHNGNIADEKIVSRIKNAKIIRTKTILEMLKEVMYGEADVTFGNGATEYMISKKGLPYLTNAFAVNEPLKLRFAVRKEMPEAISILKKGLNIITEHEKIALMQKWFGKTQENIIKLNSKENEYLDSRKEIKMCIDPNSLPYEKIDNNGNHKGISADIIQMISKSINKPIVLVPTNTWIESLEKFKSKKCDILPTTASTPTRNKYMSFTKPYIQESLVVVTKEDQFFIKDSSYLSNQKVGVVGGYSYPELLKQVNPNINIIDVKNTEDGLKRVQKGELFAYIDALPIVAYLIQKNGILDLKIAGSLEFDIKFAIATNLDEPLLNSIMQKALDNIKEEQIRTIIGKWIAIKVEQSFDYRKLVYISLFFLIVLILVIQRNRTISKLNKKLEVSNKEIEEKNELLKELAITDNLTKLYNRNKLDEVLLNESNRSNRFSHSFGVIIIDIDYFKSTNDKHGHLIGDMILKEFADILKSNSRKTDTVGRWGGEEFLIICTETDLEGIVTFAQHLRKEILTFSFSLNEQKTASFGVSIYKKNEDIKEMIKRADDALYRAKGNGRNRVEI